MTSGVNPSQRMLTFIRRVGAANVKQLQLHRGQAAFLTIPGNVVSQGTDSRIITVITTNNITECSGYLVPSSAGLFFFSLLLLCRERRR